MKANYIYTNEKTAEQLIATVMSKKQATSLLFARTSTTTALSPCYSFIDYTQAVGRTYRNGQAQKCTFYHLKAAKTIDSAIYEALDEKRDFDDKLTGKSQDSWLEILGG